MTRDDVIDVLTVVAAATKRTVGQADVDIWFGVMGHCDKQLSLEAVRNHLRDRPGVWLEPGHVVEGVRAIRRDRCEREPDEVREARQEALAAKAIEDAEALAERKGIPGPVKFHRPKGNHLAVRCPWCHADVGAPCVVPGTNDRLVRETMHPSRRELIEARK